MADDTRKTRRKIKRKRPTDAEMLEEILERMHEHLKSAEDFQPKVADFLKVLEMKYKLKLTEGSLQKLLDVIDGARKDELGKAEGDNE